ncbi:unnamed protein product, partial [Laminaria digitata]
MTAEEDAVALAAAAVVALAETVRRRNGFVEEKRPAGGDESWMCAVRPKGSTSDGSKKGNRTRATTATDLSPNIVTLSSVDYGFNNNAAATDRHDTRGPSGADGDDTSAGAAAAAATTTTTTTTGEEAIPDDRISPFDANNSSLWLRAAAAATSAMTPQSRRGGVGGPSNSFSSAAGGGRHHHHLRQNSISSSYSATGEDGGQAEIFSALRRAARGLTKNTAKIAPLRRPQSLPPAPDASANANVAASARQTRLSSSSSSTSPPLAGGGGGGDALFSSSPFKKTPDDLALAHGPALTLPLALDDYDFSPISPSDMKQSGGGFSGTGGLEKNKNGRRPSRAEEGGLGKTPLVSPFGSGWSSDGGDTCDSTASSTEQSEESSASAVAARARVVAEGD